MMMYTVSRSGSGSGSAFSLELALEPGLASGSELARALEQKSVLAQASVAGLGPLWALAWESELVSATA